MVEYVLWAGAHGTRTVRGEAVPKVGDHVDIHEHLLVVERVEHRLDRCWRAEIWVFAKEPLK